MAQLNNSNTLSWDGASALASNVTAHSVDDPRTFVSFMDLITDGAKRIRKRPGIGTSLGADAAYPITGLHEYERVDPTTGQSTFYVFRGTPLSIEVWNGTGWTGMALPFTPNGIGYGSNYPPWSFCNFANRCFATKAESAIVFDGTSWRLMGIADPIAAATYALGGSYSIGTVSATHGSPTITGTIPAIWDNSPTGDSGKWIDIDGVRYTISTVAVNGNGTTVAPVLTLTENFKEPTASGLTYGIHRGLMDWSTPPKYSWGYYNPTTGHCSNRAPITEISEKDQAGVTPTITIAGSAQNTTSYNAGYTQIKMFRTAKEGNQLVTIDYVLANNGAGTSIVFLETATTSKDTALTNQVAPLTTNKPPPTALSCILAYMGRLWALRPSDPTNTPPDAPRLYFSALSGTVSEIPFGVGEESWPRLFSRSGIAHPRGLLVAGGGSPTNALIIQSSEGDYTLDGYDPMTFSDPYPLYSRKSGGFFGGAVGVDEFNQDRTLPMYRRGRYVQFFRDRRLIDSQLGDLGTPIQDKLNNFNSALIDQVRLARHVYQSANYLLLTGAAGAMMSNSYTIAYDFDYQRVSEWNFGFVCSTIVHNASGGIEIWAASPGGQVFRLMQANTWRDGALDFAPYFKTAPLSFERTSRLARARLFVAPTGAELLTWSVTIYTDENQSGTAYTFSAAPTMFQSAQGRELVCEFSSPITAQTFQAMVTFPTANQDLIVEKFELTFADDQDYEDVT